MAQPNSRETLQSYALRQLGAPVLEINLDSAQMSDNLDDAIAYWQEFSSDAKYRTYISHALTDSDLTNRYISVDSSVATVSSLFAIPLMGFAVNQLKYDMLLNMTHNQLHDLAYYEQMLQHVSLIDQRLNGMPQVSYVRHADRLYFHGDDWEDDLEAGKYIMYEAHVLLNPNVHTQVYNDLWLKDYTQALFQRQWGRNLIKFEGMQLPGGVTLNGARILDDANNEILKLRDKIRLDHEMPVDFYVG